MISNEVSKFLWMRRNKQIFKIRKISLPTKFECEFTFFCDYVTHFSYVYGEIKGDISDSSKEK